MDRNCINKEAKKNVLIGKIGRSVRFKNCNVNSGADIPVILFSNLARMNPEYNFFFICPNQLNKLKDKEYDYIFPNHNVYSAYSKTEDESKHPFDPILDYFKDNDIKPDFGIFCYGFSLQLNIPKYTWNEKKQDWKKPLNMTANYVGSVFYVLNKLNIPWYNISEDARYISPNAYDLTNNERMVFTQINLTYDEIQKDEYLSKHTDFWNKNVKMVYAYTEKMFLMGVDRNWKDKIDIDRKLNSKGNHLIVISNGYGSGNTFNTGTHGKSCRLPTYKQYIIDNLIGTEYEGTKIYGMWDEEILNKYPQIEDKRLIDLKDEVADAKYSLVYSIMPGFVTVKPLEMIMNGIIPFIHPDYDPKRLLGLPEFIYLKDEKDLIEKMRLLDSNSDKYLELLNELFSYITEDDLNGKNINNTFFTLIANDLNFEYDLKNGVEKTIFNRYNKDLISFNEIQ